VKITKSIHGPNQMRFTHAIVRPPGRNFAGALTTANLGAPDLVTAQRQHMAYCAALEKCGMKVTRLKADHQLPDATFVEDAAIVLRTDALLTRPGAPSRRDETAAMQPGLKPFFPVLNEILPPGTLDGGDVCEADGRFFIGISARTNLHGVRQLTQWLALRGYSALPVDIRQKPGLLHLKSGLAYLGDNRIVAVDTLAAETFLADYQLVRVPPGEEYAANCLRINDTVLVARGFPRFETAVRKLGYRVMTLEVSEFRKMDGGLSCLSLRW